MYQFKNQILGIIVYDRKYILHNVVCVEDFLENIDIIGNDDIF